MKKNTKIRRVTRYLPLPWDSASLTSSFLVLVSVILIIISALKPQSFENPRMIITDIFSPALSIVSLPFQHLSIFLHDVTGFAQMQADNARLEQENQRLREWYQVALLLESENKSLRELLNLKTDANHEHVSARVIADSGNAYAKSILVKAGKNESVQKGNAVLSGVGLIGRIVEASQETSRILLATDINSRIPVVVEDTGQHAVMTGTNATNPRLIHLPQDSEIKQGARIVTSGYGGVFPQGLPVGRVVKNNNGDLEIMLYADFSSLQIVRIIRQQGQKEK